MPNNPASKLRGKKLPTDIWDFLDSNVPTLIIKVLHRYVEEVEKENEILQRMWNVTQHDNRVLAARIEEIQDEIIRLKGERVQSKPVNTLKDSKLKKERPAPRPRYPWNYKR